MEGHIYYIQCFIKIVSPSGHVISSISLVCTLTLGGGLRMGPPLSWVWVLLLLLVPLFLVSSLVWVFPLFSVSCLLSSCPALL